MRKLMAVLALAALVAACTDLPTATTGADRTRVVRATPEHVSVSIVGAPYVRPQVTCTWIAVVSGGQYPYTYQWYLNGSPAGTEQSFSYSAGTTFLRLEVRVNDSGSGGGSAQLTVDIDQNAEQCLQ